MDRRPLCVGGEGGGPEGTSAPRLEKSHWPVDLIPASCVA